jgi:hypothetical protein
MGPQHVHSAVVVKIPDGQPPGREILAEDGPAFCADAAQRLSISVKEQQRFTIGHILLLRFSTPVIVTNNLIAGEGEEADDSSEAIRVSPPDP